MTQVDMLDTGSLPARAAGPPGSTGPPGLPGGQRPRLAGMDAARAVAIIGMATVHFGPTAPAPSTWPALLYGLSHGRASLLFALLAGVGVTLLAGDRDPPRWRRAWPRLAWRVAVLLPLGLALELLDVSPLVILQYYAVFFLLAAPAVFLRDRLVLAAAGLLAVAGPLAYLLTERARPEWFNRFDPAALTDPPLEIARALVLTGSYPAVVWLVPVLFGMWLGRRRLTATATRFGMLIGGGVTAGAAVALGSVLPDRGWWELASADAHSQMILWLVGGTGAATAVLGLFLLLGDLLGRLMWPLAAMGQLALTIYIGHLLLLAAAPGTFTEYGVHEAFILVGKFAVAAAVLSVLWRAVLPRGPVEMVLHLPFALAGHLRRPEAPAARGQVGADWEAGAADEPAAEGEPGGAAPTGQP